MSYGSLENKQNKKENKKKILYFAWGVRYFMRQVKICIELTDAFSLK